MCIFHPAVCFVCHWREGYLFVPCEAFSEKFLQAQSKRDRHVSPGTHFHCPELSWPASRDHKHFICEHCMYETSYLLASPNRNYYNAALEQVLQRVKQRSQAKELYTHEPLHHVFEWMKEVDNRFSRPLEAGVPSYWLGLLDPNDFIDLPAHNLVHEYIGELDAQPKPDFWEVRAERADSSWATVWIPSCNLCKPTGEDPKMGTDQEIEFEPNAPAWKAIQDIQNNPDSVKKWRWLRITTGDIVKPCLRCRAKEEVFREDIYEMLETTNNCDWIQSLFTWLKQRPCDARLCWNDSWRQDALLPSANKTKIPWDFREELIREAERIMDAKWEEMTDISWKDIYYPPGSARLFKKHHGIPYQVNTSEPSEP